MTSILSEYIQSRFGTLGKDDAIQLCLTIFCTLDFLPDDLKEIEWDRSKISSEFSLLAQQGLITEIDKNAEAESYWNEMITHFMTGKLKLRESFKAALKNK